ncbi:helix-turn-helix transcriptional regulator [Orbus wheelerorum]|uniref:XRE family transcriptional regulator n=1 Tax=Orbus wheelerorum TaxID=3074111 RepID=UPI00370D995F
MSFTERFNLAMKNKGISQGKLAESIGVAQSGIWKLTSGVSKTSRKIIEISNVLDVNPEWLATGKGDMHSKNKINEIDMDTSTQVNEWDSNTPLHDDEVEVPYFQSIELAAGHGTVNSEDYDGKKLRFDKSFFRRKGVQKENIICFPVIGDSMEPRIPNGATVAIDTIKKDIVDGDIYAIYQGDLCRLKRLYRMPHNKLRINSFNSVDNPDEIDEQSNVEIIGRVFYCSFDM